MPACFTGDPVSVVDDADDADDDDDGGSLEFSENKNCVYV